MAVTNAAEQNALNGLTAGAQLSADMNGQAYPDIPNVLPHEKVFPIQIGSKLFRLSGASISSDAPSYFSQFFQREINKSKDSSGVRTLYIDRDPDTFQDISKHLQGYHVEPRDSEHFVKLLADAQFYGLPRLMAMLFDSEIFVDVGHRQFRVSRDVFSSPGDSPNYFSLGFAMYFSSPSEGFPGAEHKGLLRPPPMPSPSVPNRSPDIFAELLHMLRGYPIKVRDEEHRDALLRDCRYFHLRGLEQKLVRHSISFNLKRNQSEITLRLEDIRQSGIAVVEDSTHTDTTQDVARVRYARPYVDEVSHFLVLEIGGESTKIDLQLMRADFTGQTKARISSLFQVVANKMNLPASQPLGLMMMAGKSTSQPPSPANTPLSEDQVRIVVTHNTHIVLDGETRPWADFASFSQTREDIDFDESATTSTPSTRSRAGSSPSGARPRTGMSRPGSSQAPSKKRRREVGEIERAEWIVRKAQWRLRIQRSEKTKGGMEILLVAVKLDAYSGEFGRNASELFLS